jgi:hypothetical protein|eukprot:COSAG06_NODE_5686_length_3320_cov_2.022043_2_plen_54_part_00
MPSLPLPHQQPRLNGNGSGLALPNSLHAGVRSSRLDRSLSLSRSYRALALRLR